LEEEKVEIMSAIDEHDLHDYFELYEQYHQTADPALVRELDKTLTQYKDRFHQDPRSVLRLLSEKEDDFIDRFETSYKDLVFDIELHARSMDEIRRSHTYDTERKMWVPKEK
jgi:hypothetical protein